MRVMVLGLRGFPGVQGGVEVHAEHLYPLLVELGCDVEVIVRSPYMSGQDRHTWQGVCLRRLWSPRTKRLEAVVHSFLGVLYAGVKRPDVLHIHAIGPALMTPLARMLGLQVIVTHHGPDYNREKWGHFARCVLRTGEHVGMVFASERIVISKVISELVRTKYNRDTVLIPNGVVAPEVPATTGALQRFSLERYRYVLNVSRFVREKRHLDLIRAFAVASIAGWKLVLVGSLDQPDGYTRSVQSLSETTPNVVLTGFQSGLALQELYANAGIFVLPSSHEGLPIALLEALSYGLPALASAIPANLEIGLPTERYFSLGDTTVLANLLRSLVGRGFDPDRRRELRAWIANRYSWQRIAEQTLTVYENISKRK